MWLTFYKGIYYLSIDARQRAIVRGWLRKMA